MSRLSSLLCSSAPGSHHPQRSGPAVCGLAAACPLDMAWTVSELTPVAESMSNVMNAVWCHDLCQEAVKGPAQVAWPFVVLLPPLMALNRLVRPGKSAAVYLPSTLLRYLAFKLTVDVQQLPALQVALPPPAPCL